MRPTLVERLAAALDTERARWFYWVPVLLGGGIAAYFVLPREPLLAVAVAPFAASLLLLAVAPAGSVLVVLVRALALVSAGFALIAVRAAVVSAPVLERAMGPVGVRGFVELVEPREGRGERVTLRVTRLEGVDPAQTPYRIRVRTLARLDGLKPGDAISLRAYLAPPAPPALPGGYDFARYAFFLRLGAVGYALAPPKPDPDAGPPPSWLVFQARLERFRQAIGKRVTDALPGENGAIATALITGERGGITQATNDAFRDSGLFHILSISGLHMAIMGGAVFWSARLLFALFPSIALRHPVKKWAALTASAGSLAYLAISGGSFATIRSFIMITIMFLAILLDRPAVALRNVALSALIILILFPESLLDVGFQMSFAAVVALVAAYEAIRGRFSHQRSWGEFGLPVRGLLFLGGIVLSTLVASAAVTPFALYHFHKSQQFAVLANLLAVPLCNVVVMPAALATLVALPFGLEAGPLAVMGAGIEGMVWTARWVAALPGAVLTVPAIPATSFALMLAGGLWLLLWGERWRLAGGVVIVAGLAAAPFGARPDLLVGRDGRLVAVRADDGRLTVLPASGSRFEVARWLEHDGDGRPADAAAGSGRGLACDRLGCTIGIKGKRVAVARHPAALADDCAKADVLVLDVPAPRVCPRPGAVVDFIAVRTQGTHAVFVEPSGALHIETVAGQRGLRPWSPPHPWSAEGRRRTAEARSAAVAESKRPRASHDAESAGTPGAQAIAGRVRSFASSARRLAPQSPPMPRPEDEDDLPAWTRSQHADE
ncbi:MAG: ComEC/Rec2 family competence protein [Hyphomicrobiaceae bacterium]